MGVVAELLFCAFAVVLVVCILKIHLSRRKKKEFFKKIQGPSGVPLIGNVLDLRKPSTLLKSLLSYTDQFGGIVKIQIGLDQQLLVSDYKFIEFVLSSNKIAHKSAAYQLLHPWLGTGLLTSNGERNKNHRKILTPTFHFKILEQFLDTFESVGDHLIQKLNSCVDNKNFDIFHYITLTTLDIICETAMGTKVNALEVDSKYVKCVKDTCRLVVEKSFSVIKRIELFYRHTKDSQKLNRAISTLHNHTNMLIQSRKKELANADVREHNEDDVGVKKKMVFLDLLLQSVETSKFTDEDIREEVDTFMFGGHDTTACCMSFGLYCLANHPEVQQKIFEEQQEIFGDDIQNPNVTYNSLQSMKYLELVIKETLRLYPPVPLYSRQTDQDVEFNGMKIPKGVIIRIFVYAIHRNPEIYPDPEKFDPSRFERLAGKYPYAFIPFSAGPRNCIGQKFAMLEMKSVLSKILRSFEIVPATPEHKIQLSSEIVLNSSNGIRIGLKRRTINSN